MTLHAQQAVAPNPDHVPPTQAEHTVAPAVDEKVPLVQATHAVRLAM